jgi:hypothetical protein
MNRLRDDDRYVRYNHNDGAAMRKKNFFSTYSDNDSNTMKKQGCVSTSYTDNDCNITRVDGRWRALTKADWVRLKKDGSVTS